jgi:hypothetical protein
MVKQRDSNRRGTHNDIEQGKGFLPFTQVLPGGADLVVSRHSQIPIPCSAAKVP